MNFKQKLDPQAGITQLSGIGSPEGSVIGYVGQTYRNTNNNDLYEKASGDGTSTGWVQKTGAGSSVPDATETQSGKVELANQTEAEAGEDDGNKAMNPLKTKQAFDAFIAAYLNNKIVLCRAQTNEVSYSGNTFLKTPTVVISQGAITYTNLSGIFTVNKECTLMITADVSFRNNGTASNDTSYLSITKAGTSGILEPVTTLNMNPSGLVSDSQNLIQTITSAISFATGDRFRIEITGVNATQFYTNAITTITEQ